MTERKIEIGKAIGYGWESVMKNFWYFVGVAVVYVIASGIGNIHSKGGSLGLIGFLLTILITAGYLKLSLSYFDGKKLPFADLFAQTKYFWRILGASVLVGLIVVGGLILLIIPGIYWGLKYQFTFILIVDKDLGILEAMRESARLTLGVKFPLLGFGFVSLGVMILGAIVFGVGVLVAMPITWLAQIFIYKNLQKTA